MLDETKMESVKEMLALLKEEIGNTYCVLADYPSIADGSNIILFRSAKTETCNMFLEELEKKCTNVNVFLYGEEDALLQSKQYANLNIKYCIMQGKFSVEDVLDYRLQLGDSNIDNIFFLGGAVHSKQLLNVYDVICEMFSANIPVYKYMKGNGLVQYYDFFHYTDTFKLYLNTYKWFSDLLKS